MTLLAAWAGAQTAVLECAAASSHGGRATLTFRTGVVAGMDVARSTLLLHLRQAAPAPKRIKVNGRATPVTVLEQGWISVVVPGREALRPLVVEGAAFDGPAAPGLAPYLAVEGPTARKGK